MTYKPLERERIIQVIVHQERDEDSSGENEHLMSNVLDHLRKRFSGVDTRDELVLCFCNNRLIDTQNVMLLTTKSERKLVMTLLSIIQGIEAIVSEWVDKHFVQIRICPHDNGQHEQFLDQFQILEKAYSAVETV